MYNVASNINLNRLLALHLNSFLDECLLNVQLGGFPGAAPIRLESSIEEAEIISPLQCPAAVPGKRVSGLRSKNRQCELPNLTNEQKMTSGIVGAVEILTRWNFLLTSFLKKTYLEHRLNTVLHIFKLVIHNRIPVTVPAACAESYQKP